MHHFHLIYRNNQYSIETTDYGIPDDTICSIESEAIIQQEHLNKILLGYDGPATFICKEQAASKFFISMDNIHRLIKRRIQKRRKISIPRKR